MIRFFYTLLALVIVFVGLSFAYKNSQIVQIGYYFGLDWQAPLSLILLSVLAIGVSLGFVASLLLVLRMQRQLAQSRRERRDLEQELRNLRALPIKDVL